MRLPPGLDDARLVGSGGLGDVYVATRASTGGEVAVKVLRQQGGPDAVLRRARRERDALSSLRGHPHVVHLEDVLQTDDGQVLLVMEFMSGGAIDDYAQRAGGTLTIEQTVLVGEQAASALSSAHGLGVVHRDIKPQNLLINSFGHVKVCDFGISSLGASAEFAERTDALSYRYASPEEIRGDDHVGPLTDVYSLGVTLAVLMTGRFVTHETRDRLLDPSSVPSVDGGSLDGVERSLRELIVDCLSSDLADRPDSDQLARRLSALGAQLGPDRDRHLSRIAGGPADVESAPTNTPTPSPSPLASGTSSSHPAIPSGVPGVADATTARPAVPSGASSPSTTRPPTGRPRRSGRSTTATALWVLVGMLAVAIVVVVVLIVLDGSSDASALDVVHGARRSGNPGGLPLGGWSAG